MAASGIRVGYWDVVPSQPPSLVIAARDSEERAGWSRFRVVL
jgi:hypothetical protein